jgi:16S rRNA (uracil1498-N3)-methyltransferase
MTRRRWIADRVAGNRAWLTGANAEHLARVLRAKPGQQFEVAAEGTLRIGTVLAVSPGQVEFELGEPLLASPLPEVTVFLSIFKFDRFEWAVEKLTELGIATIVPVIARRSELHLAAAGEKRVERWRKIAHESAQQARRLAPPEILSPAPLKKAISSATACRIVLSELEDSVSLRSRLQECRPPIALAFGPEGGWAQEELDLFRSTGWASASLGDTILRAETAAIAAVAVVMAELDSRVIAGSQHLTTDDTDSH